MCGRSYITYTDEELEMRYLQQRKVELPKFKSSYNLAPTQLSPVVRNLKETIKIDLLRWGLVPAWAKTVKDAAKYSLINARGEEILEKRTYKDAFLHRRCIVPLSGFYEWQRLDQTKRPFAIHLKEDPIMSVAGVCEHWQSKETEETVDSFSILTIQANSLMEKIHARMPVILDRKDEASWLDSENKNIAGLQKLIKPCPSEWLDAYEISTLVNSPRNNAKEILEPVSH